MVDSGVVILSAISACMNMAKQCWHCSPGGKRSYFLMYMKWVNGLELLDPLSEGNLCINHMYLLK